MICCLIYGEEDVGFLPQFFGFKREEEQGGIGLGTKGKNGMRSGLLKLFGKELGLGGVGLLE